jgi:hypothetical protein
MTHLPDHIWFVRSNGGSGSYPINRQGWRVVGTFVAGIVASALIGGLLSTSTSPWLWATVIALGMAGSAAWFIMTARKHTDYAITYNEFIKEKKNA